MVLSCLYGVKLVFHLKKKAASFVLFYACVAVTLCDFQKRIGKKQRRKKIRGKKTSASM